MAEHKKDYYDVIVIGAGHAGCEAAAASARLGCKTALFTFNLDNIAWMSCNPSIGGPAKGQIVGEVDALGGLMGQVADQTFIQMKMLNRSRGPAVQCLRSQNDKRLYSHVMRRRLELEPNLDIKQAEIRDIVIENNQAQGVITVLGKHYHAKSIVIATGTFLNGKIFIGMQSFSAGRISELSSNFLSKSLLPYFKLGRLKTGTPPRLDSRTIDFSKLQPQPGDDLFLHFSYKTEYNEAYKNQLPCYLAHTNLEMHQCILNNLDRSPLYQKIIGGKGPRYCPSIEDKVVRFPDKIRHQFFVEPEGRDTNEIYAQGLNTSLPEDVQEKMLRLIPGFEQVELLKPGYAIEYDYALPSQLQPSLASKLVKNLYFSGQINGTSGYEEAAGQGIVAGINAALNVQKKQPLILRREESYIGTLIDDLISKTIEEPYRMMTSRSEYRIILRQDNPTFRLAKKAHEIGLISSDDYDIICAQQKSIQSIIALWKKQTLSEAIRSQLKLKDVLSIYQLIKRPEILFTDLIKFEFVNTYELEASEKAYIEIKYEGYTKKLKSSIDRLLKSDSRGLKNIDYTQILGLKKESREKLIHYQPKTIFEAKKIAGVNPADILVLISYLDKPRKAH